LPAASFSPAEPTTAHATRAPRRPVIVVAEADAGACTLWRGRQEIHLVNIELLPRFRGLGIGSALLRQWIVRAKSARVPFTLSVRDDNRAALRLYQRLRFAVRTHANGYISLQKDS